MYLVVEYLKITMQYIKFLFAQKNYELSHEEAIKIIEFMKIFIKNKDHMEFKKYITRFLKDINCRDVELRNDIMAVLKDWCYTVNKKK